MRNILILLTAASFIPLAQANQTPNFFAGYQQSLTSCLADMDGAENPELALRQSGECAADSTVGFFFERGADVLSQHGKRVFGHGFHIQQSLDYSVAGDGKVRGDLDAVIPLMSIGDAGGATNSLPQGALFLQNGITRWSDEFGFDRSDTRIGLVHRFAGGARQNHTAGPSPLHFWGVSAALQQNLDRGHERHVFGADYVGTWGIGYINHYAVQSGWREGRPGFQERAIGGSEIGVKLSPTTAINLDISTGVWDSQQQLGASVRQNRVALAWKPHPYLQLTSTWRGGNQTDERNDMRISFVKPLGVKRGKAQWAGLGIANRGEVNAEEVWRTVDSENRIEVIERKAPVSGVTAGDVTVRFLRENVPSGGELRLQAQVADAVVNPVRVVVQLMPGEGANPAIAGEDFPAEPIEIVIAQGATVGVAEVDLPMNPNLKSRRTVRVEIIEVGGQS